MPVYKEFVERYPAPGMLVREQPARLLETVGPLGLHWRAALLIAMAERLAELGEVPSDLEGLTKLPGVGQYAASAYLSLHLGRRAVLIDSNIVRLLGRMFGFPVDAETRRKRWLLEIADKLTPTRAFQQYNFALLDLAMNLCGIHPRCGECPLASRYCSHARLLRAI